MGEIGLRIWVKDKHKYYDIIGIGFKNGFISNIILRDEKGGTLTIGGNPYLSCIIEQSIGMQDKNSVEICEGDIVKVEKVWHGETSYENVEVAYKNDNACFFGNVIDENGWHRSSEYFPNSPCYLEVIGNIHDNPELLKGDK